MRRRKKTTIRAAYRRDRKSVDKPARGVRQEPARTTDAVMRLASEAAALAAGFEVCAKHAKQALTAEVAAPLAAQIRDVAAHALSLAVTLGHEARRGGARTCERMRWEWLASTAALLDGTPDARLAAECARVASHARDDARLVVRSLADGPERHLAHSIAVALERARQAAEAIGRSLTGAVLRHASAPA